MKFADFKMRQIVFEIRYEPAYVLWDRAGAIAKEIKRLFPSVELDEGKPNKQVFSDDLVTIGTGVDSAYIAVKQPKNALEFAEHIASITDVWITFLELRKLTRVGTRVMYVKEFETSEQCGNALVELGLVRFPAPPFFNHKGSPKQCDLRLYWEEDGFQTQLILKPERHELKVAAGLPDRSVERRLESYDVVLLDIDRATRGTVDLSKFYVVEWLKGINHLVFRDVDRLFNPITNS